MVGEGFIHIRTSECLFGSTMRTTIATIALITTT
jgi:hypothetical protein